MQFLFRNEDDAFKRVTHLKRFLLPAIIVFLIAVPIAAVPQASATSGAAGMPTGDTATASFTVRAPVTMAVSYSIVGGGSPTAPVFHYVLNGVSKSLTLSNTSKSVSTDAGSAWWVTTNPLGGSNSSQRWYSAQQLTGTASATTIKFMFQHQYYLTMKASPTGASTIAPTSDWYNSGQKVTITANVNHPHPLRGWTGTGIGSYTGTANPATVTMNSAITETANFA
jgi:hypothetical protein